MIQQVEFFAAWIQAKFGVEFSAERQEGQGLVEYALILALVSIVAVVALRALGVAVTGVFTNITGSL